MYIIFTCIMLGAVISTALIIFSASGTDGRHILACGLGILGWSATVIVALIYSIVIWNWFAADYQSQIINREYGTNYTQAEVFYASDVIDTVRQLDRKRYEVNGDLLHEN